MRLVFPSIGTTYLEKCVAICSVIDSIIKQFILYVKHKKIDFDLLAISSNSVKFNDIPSLISNKYIYGSGKDFIYYTYWLFSDQCPYISIPRYIGKKREHINLYELLRNKKVFLSDYNETHHPAFYKMKDIGILKISPTGLISLGNSSKLAILMDLYNNEVINRWHYPKRAQIIIDEFIHKGLIKASSTLLSLPEVHYFNYILNNSEHTNALALRNKYLHGIQYAINDNEVHKNNYFILLRLLVILAIKINDDFCLEDELRKEH